MDDMGALADRLTSAADAMAALRPAIEAGEPWSLSDVYGPVPESSWGPREVLAHVAEMLSFWSGEIARMVDAGVQAGSGGEPPAFGRLEDDPVRLHIIGRDRAFPGRELVDRIGTEARRVAATLRSMPAEAASAIGRHPTRGDLSVADVAERLIVGHIEGHVVQLRESLGG